MNRGLRNTRNRGKVRLVISIYQIAFASMYCGYATSANAADGQQPPYPINGRTTAASTGHTPSRVRPNAQSTGSVGKLTRLDRQNDHSIRQLGDDTSTPTVQVHSFEAVAAQA